jgi:alpha-1,6-mannosyltransferase
MWKKIRAMSQGLPVETLGYICDRNRVAKILSAADISLAPGPLETFCLAALESLASGTPVVASQSSAVGEFLALDQKIPAGAVAPDTATGFADAIQTLLHLPGIRAMARAVAEELPWARSVSLMHNVHGISAVGERAPSVTTRRRVKIEAAS